MITEQFALVHCYEKNSTISHIADRVRAECKIICPTAKEPKLGNHTTLFTPFFAPLDEMRFMSIALKSQEILNGGGESKSNRAEIRGIEFFRNPGNDVCLFRIDFSPEYEAFIQFWRMNMSKFANWKFPPLGDDFTPHICIVEEEGLYKKVHPHVRRIEMLVHQTLFQLPSPKVMIKRGGREESYWEEFDPLVGL